MSANECTKMRFMRCHRKQLSNTTDKAHKMTKHENEHNFTDAQKCNTTR